MLRDTCLTWWATVYRARTDFGGVRSLFRHQLCGQNCFYHRHRQVQRGSNSVLKPCKLVISNAIAAWYKGSLETLVWCTVGLKNLFHLRNPPMSNGSIVKSKNCSYVLWNLIIHIHMRIWALNELTELTELTSIAICHKGHFHANKLNPIVLLARGEHHMLCNTTCMSLASLQVSLFENIECLTFTLQYMLQHVSLNLYRTSFSMKGNAMLVSCTLGGVSLELFQLWVWYSYSYMDTYFQ